MNYISVCSGIEAATVAWQRQLTDNGIRAAEKIINEVSK